MTKLDRLKKAISYLKGNETIFNQKDIVEKMHVNKSSVSSALKGNEKYLTNSFLIKFCNTFGSINYNWLITGKGKMLNSIAPSKNKLPMLSKDGVSFSIKEIALFVVDNFKYFMKVTIFSNLIELKVKDKFIQILKNKLNEK